MAPDTEILRLECESCGHRTRVEDHRRICPNCGDTMRNIGLSRE